MDECLSSSLPPYPQQALLLLCRVGGYLCLAAAACIPLCLLIYVPTLQRRCTNMKPVAVRNRMPCNLLLLHSFHSDEHLVISDSTCKSFAHACCGCLQARGRLALNLRLQKLHRLMTHNAGAEPEARSRACSSVVTCSEGEDLRSCIQLHTACQAALNAQSCRC